MYISERTANRIGTELVNSGKAKGYKVFFTRERCKDTREIVVGYKLVTF